MSINNRHIADNLLLSYIRDQVSDEQKKLVEEWLDENEANRLHLKEISTLWKHSDAYSSFDTINIAGDWDKVADRIGWGPRTIIVKPERFNYFGSLIRIAAVAIVLLSVGYLTWNLVFNQGLPTGQMAMITSDGPSTLNLPDGSMIHLNVNSSLNYPEKFRRNSREVELSGEGFFEVEPDAKRPFSVISGDTKIEVLGTSFNVFSEPERNLVTVSVTEGKVDFSPVLQEDRAIRLTTGEQGTFRDNILTKYDTTDPNVFSWKTGILHFEQAPLPEVIRSLEKHYNTIIQLKEPPLENPGLTSVFENQPLEEVLEELNLLLGLEYRQKNDTIFVQIE